MRISRNTKFLLNIMATALMIYGIALIPSILMGIRYHEDFMHYIFIISVIFITLGLLGNRFFSSEGKVTGLRTCYMTTVATWGMLILFTTLIFFLAGQGYTLSESFFESAAAWTTTGASSIGVPGMPVTLQLIRSTCNWLGGIGIIFLTLTFLPNWQFVGQKLISTEVPGPQFLTTGTTFRKTYRRIIAIYMLFTLLQFILLYAAGMPRFHALLSALSNVSTAGLQHLTARELILSSPAVKIILTVFAFCGAMNYSTFILLIRGKFDTVKKNSEIKVFSILILSAAVIMTVYMRVTGSVHTLLPTFGRSIMQAVSFASTSGYVITDISAWPNFAKSMLILLAIIGGCAVSTAGGVKIARLICVLKTVSYGNLRHIHPRIVKPIIFNGKTINNNVIWKVNIYLLTFMIALFAGAAVISLSTASVSDAMNISIAMITNNGTTVSGNLGAHFGALTSFSKFAASILMIMGRLEIYPIVLLFFKSFWQHEANH